MKISFLHTNDFHGNLTAAKTDQLAVLRADADLYFDSGDCIKTGNLGIPIGTEPCWERFETLGLNASVLGNRETHPLRNVFEAKIAGAKHPILVANMTRTSGAKVFERSIIIEQAGIKVGVFGVMVPMATEAMLTKEAWSYRWTSPVTVACEVAEELAPNVDLVVALTHIGHREDVRLAGATSHINVILGGHSHTIIEAPEKHGNTWVCQGGSHGRFAGVYQWDGESLSGKLVPLS
jgi:5'-nucleotidase